MLRNAKLLHEYYFLLIFANTQQGFYGLCNIPNRRLYWINAKRFTRAFRNTAMSATNGMEQTVDNVTCNSMHVAPVGNAAGTSSTGNELLTAVK